MSNTEIILNGKFNDMYQQAIATGANKQYLSTLYKKLVKTQQDEQLKAVLKIKKNIFIE